MAFTAGELTNIANAVIDDFVRGDAMSNVLQDRPLLQWLEKNAKTTPGGKGDISAPIKGQYTSAVAGYTHNDTVTYANPANIMRAAYPWREHHVGIEVTLTELKHSGISVVDSARSLGTSDHRRKELVVLTDLLKDKLEDMAEGRARTLADLVWADGTGDAKALAGVSSIVLNDPTAIGTVGGIDQVAVTWWRNRFTLGMNTATADIVSSTIHSEIRQLRRFGGRNHQAFCGSDFLDALAAEIRAKGYYSLNGFGDKSATDISVAEVHYQGVRFVYDPHLDDASKEKYCYILDPRRLYLTKMDQEWMKRHSPARPHDQYVMYRAITDTGQLCCNQRNVHGVYSIA